MNGKVFFAILFAGPATFALECVLSSYDWFLTPQDIQARGVESKGYSLLQHGGMWLMAFLVVPLVALIVSKYDLPYRSRSGIGLLTVALATAFTALAYYVKAGRTIPEPLAHHGSASSVGLVNAVLTALVLWVVFLWYFTKTTPLPSGQDLWVVTVGLVVYAWLSNLKFSSHWDWRTSYWRASLAYTIVICAMAGVNWLWVQRR
jgi:hypothetical protein